MTLHSLFYQVMDTFCLICSCSKFDFNYTIFLLLSLSIAGQNQAKSKFFIIPYYHLITRVHNDVVTDRFFIILC